MIARGQVLVGVRSYRATIAAMPATEKISVAMGREELRLAKTAAREAGVSLSAFVTEAVRDRLTEKRRREAARDVLAMFAPDDFPTPAHEQELLALWSTPAEVPASGSTSVKQARRKLPTGAARGRKSAAPEKRR